MQPESLHALVLDRELGELSPETTELLEAWLAEHPETAAALPSIRRTCATTREAIRRFPELLRPESNVRSQPWVRFRLISVAVAASLVVLLGGTAWLGVRAGRLSAPRTEAANHRPAGLTAPPNPASPDGPWARYRLVSGPHGGLGVIRHDRNAAF